MADSPAKEASPFRTIGEVSAETGLPQHVLRYWETRFPELRPLQRAGNRRYYRAADVALVKRIDRLLNHEGYTVRGVQQLLAQDRIDAPAPAPASPAAAPPLPAIDVVATLRGLRDMLARALTEDAAHTI